MTTTASLYNKMRFLVLIGLPALGTLYFAMAGLLGLPAEKTVVGLLFALDLILGIGVFWGSRTVGDSPSSFDGEMAVKRAGDRIVFQMGFRDEDQLEDLVNKESVHFKVTHLDE